MSDLKEIAGAQAQTTGIVNIPNAAPKASKVSAEIEALDLESKKLELQTEKPYQWSNIEAACSERQCRTEALQSP